jgi:hypothetical protein
MSCLRCLNLGTATLLLLLQRLPALRVAVQSAELAAPSRVVALLQSAFATVAGLGAVHSLAGATALVTTVPTPATATVGTPFQVGMVVTGAQTPAASWSIFGSIPPGLSFSGKTSGTVNAQTLVLNGTPTTPGSYRIQVQAWEKVNASGDRSSLFNYTVNVVAAAAVGPTLTAQPASQSVTAGASVTFSVTATGSPAPTYQWQLNGQALAGATGATLTLPNVQASQAGNYSVVVSNAGGIVQSAVAVLAVTTPPPPATGPAITAAPQSQHVNPGAAATFSVTASGATLSYQWTKNGSPLPGATQSSLRLPAASSNDMGFYAVTVSSPAGTVQSDAATLTVAVGGASRLVNVSTRGFVPPGGDLTPGFVLQGSVPKSVLIRAVGPTLGSFGVGGTLPDPVLGVIPLGGANAVANNDNWGGGSTLQSAFSRAGAFPFAGTDSADAAAELSLPATGASGYTVRITSKNAAAGGIALAEVYDEDPLSAPVRLVNVSTSGFVGSGEQALVPGFFIGGTAPKQLLIRAVGPGLAQFGVGGVLSDPQLSLVPLGQDFAVAANDNWGGSAALQTAFSQAGAFALPAGSKDAAVLVRLPPGGYTVVVSGVAGGTGTALVEIYDLDP